MKWATAILTVLILSILSDCSNDELNDKPKVPAVSKDAKSSEELRVVIRWGGDDFASKQDLELRDKIVSLVAERNVGEIIRSGTGMGWMDIWIKVKDKNEARRELEKTMKEVSPNTKFTLE